MVFSIDGRSRALDSSLQRGWSAVDRITVVLAGLLGGRLVGGFGGMRATGPVAVGTRIANPCQPRTIGLIWFIKFSKFSGFARPPG